jgi:hypothetical protein
MPVGYRMVTKNFGCQGIWAVKSGLVPKSCIQWQLKVIETSLGPILQLGHVWVKYETHNFVILCIFFLTCEDYVYSKQLMSYIWKKVGVLWRVFKFTTPIVKIIMC